MRRKVYRLQHFVFTPENNLSVAKESIELDYAYNTIVGYFIDFGMPVYTFLKTNEVICFQFDVAPRKWIQLFPPYLYQQENKYSIIISPIYDWKFKENDKIKITLMLTHTPK